MTLLFFFACAAFVATFIGGSFTLRFRDKLHLILGFSAGAVAGVALFDLLPEAIELGTRYHGAATVALFVALGFFGYLILDRLILLHTHDEAEGNRISESVPSAAERNALRNSVSEALLHRGSFGAATLSAHSFLDGVAIGAGFQVSPAIGLIVAIAVLTHDFSDGINTVNLVLRNGGNVKRALRWLVADAVAPVLGVASTLLFRIPESTIGLVLATFVGTFLYLSASDLIPESHHRHPRALTTGMTLAGALVIWIVVQLA